VDHEVPDLLARIILLFFQHSLSHEVALSRHVLLEEAQRDCNLELFIVEPEILCLSRVHHELVDPLSRHLQFEEVVVDDCGLDVLRVNILAEGGTAQHALDLIAHVDEIVKPYIFIPYHLLHDDLLRARALLVLGETEEVVLLEGRWAELLGHLLLGHLGLHAVEHAFEFLLKKLAHEGIKHSEEVARIPGGYRILAVETFLAPEFNFGLNVGVAALFAVDFLEVKVTVAPGEFGTVEFIALERGLSSLEVVVDELVETHVGGGARTAAEFAHIDCVDGSFTAFFFLPLGARVQAGSGFLPAAIDLVEYFVSNCVHFGVLRGPVVVAMDVDWCWTFQVHLGFPPVS